MTEDDFEIWLVSLEDRAIAGDTAAVLDELNQTPANDLDEHDRGRMRGLAICCLEWSGMDPLAKGLATELCEGDLAVALSAAIECSELDELEYAEDMFRDLCERWPDDVFPQFNLGVVLQKREEHEQAIKCFDRALRIDRTFSPAMLERARSYNELRDFSTASQTYRAYLKEEPDDAWEWVSLGIVESEREEYGSALEAYDRARRADPSCISAHYNFGVTAARMHDDDLLASAVECLRDLAPNDCRLFLLRAYEVEQAAPEEAWTFAAKAVELAQDAEDDEHLYEHALEVLLQVGLNNNLPEYCNRVIDDAFGDPHALSPVLDAERRLRGDRAKNASLWTVRIEVEVTEPDAIARVTGDADYDASGIGYVRVYRVWATSARNAEELAVACEERGGYGRVVEIIDVKQHEGAFDERLGVEWRSEMYGFDLEEPD